MSSQFVSGKNRRLKSAEDAKLIIKYPSASPIKQDSLVCNLIPEEPPRLIEQTDHRTRSHQVASFSSGSLTCGRSADGNSYSNYIAQESMQDRSMSKQKEAQAPKMSHSRVEYPVTNVTSGVYEGEHAHQVWSKNSHDLSRSYGYHTSDGSQKRDETPNVQIVSRAPSVASVRSQPFGQTVGFQSAELDGDSILDHQRDPTVPAKIRVVPKPSGNVEEASQLLKMWLQKTRNKQQDQKSAMHPAETISKAVEVNGHQKSNDSGFEGEGEHQKGAAAVRMRFRDQAAATYFPDDQSSIADSGIDTDSRSVCTTPYTPRFKFQLLTPKFTRTSDQSNESQGRVNHDDHPLKSPGNEQQEMDDDSDAETPLTQPSVSYTPQRSVNSPIISSDAVQGPPRESDPSLLNSFVDQRCSRDSAYENRRFSPQMSMNPAGPEFARTPVGASDTSCSYNLSRTPDVTKYGPPTTQGQFVYPSTLQRLVVAQEANSMSPLPPHSKILQSPKILQSQNVGFPTNHDHVLQPAAACSYGSPRTPLSSVLMTTSLTTPTKFGPSTTLSPQKLSADGHEANRSPQNGAGMPDDILAAVCSYGSPRTPLSSVLTTTSLTATTKFGPSTPQKLSADGHEAYRSPQKPDDILFQLNADQMQSGMNWDETVDLSMEKFSKPPVKSPPFAPRPHMIHNSTEFPDQGDRIMRSEPPRCNTQMESVVQRAPALTFPQAQSPLQEVHQGLIERPVAVQEVVLPSPKFSCTEQSIEGRIEDSGDIATDPNCKAISSAQSDVPDKNKIATDIRMDIPPECRPQKQQAPEIHREMDTGCIGERSRYFQTSGSESTFAFDFPDVSKGMETRAPFSPAFFAPATPSAVTPAQASGSPSFFEMFQEEGPTAVESGVERASASAAPSDAMMFSFAFSGQPSSSVAADVNPFSFFND